MLNQMQRLKQMNNPNLSENLSVIQAIQLILAPGVMISACGLLLLGIKQ